MYCTAVVTYLHGVCKWNGEDSHCDVGNRQVDEKSPQISRRPKQKNEILIMQLHGTVKMVHLYHTCSHSLVFVFWCFQNNITIYVSELICPHPHIRV